MVCSRFSVFSSYCLLNLDVRSCHDDKIHHRIKNHNIEIQQNTHNVRASALQAICAKQRTHSESQIHTTPSTTAHNLFTINFPHLFVSNAKCIQLKMKRKWRQPFNNHRNCNIIPVFQHRIASYSEFCKMSFIRRYQSRVCVIHQPRIFFEKAKFLIMTNALFGEELKVTKVKIAISLLQNRFKNVKIWVSVIEMPSSQYFRGCSPSERTILSKYSWVWCNNWQNLSCRNELQLLTFHFHYTKTNEQNE